MQPDDDDAPPQRPSTEETARLIVGLHASGVTAEAIADELGCDGAFVKATVAKLHRQINVASPGWRDDQATRLVVVAWAELRRIRERIAAAVAEGGRPAREDEKLVREWVERISKMTGVETRRVEATLTGQNRPLAEVLDEMRRAGLPESVIAAYATPPGRPTTEGAG